MEQNGGMSHPSYKNETEVGQENTSISAAVPCVPSVPPQKSNIVEKTDAVADFIEDVEERAAIMEFDAGLPRIEADAAAYADCKGRHSL